MSCKNKPAARPVTLHLKPKAPAPERSSRGSRRQCDGCCGRCTRRANSGEGGTEA